MNEILKKLGKRAYALPFAIAILLLCILGLAMMPMMHMQAKDLPVAVVNLDKGAQLPNGEALNAGDKIVENMTSAAEGASDGSEGGASESPVVWTQLESKAQADEALDAGEYFAAIIIPEDFTEEQMAGQSALSTTLASGITELMSAQAQSAAPGASAGSSLTGGSADASGMAAAQQQAQSGVAQKMQAVIADAVSAQQQAEKPTIELIVNTAKSPMVAQTIQQMVTSMLSQAGVQVDVSSVGAEQDSANPIAGMLGTQMMVMPMMMLSLIMSLFAIVLMRLPKKRSSVTQKAQVAGKQIAFIAIASLVAATCSYGIIAWFGGVEVSAFTIVYLWVCSFCIMLANIGLCDIAVPLGAIVMVCVFALGMGTAVLPAQMLPEFWADWVVPWAPQAAIGDGVRNIMYMGGNGFEAGFGLLAGWGCVGLVALIIALFIPSKKSDTSVESDSIEVAAMH